MRGRGSAEVHAPEVGQLTSERGRGAQDELDEPKSCWRVGSDERALIDQSWSVPLCKPSEGVHAPAAPSTRRIAADLFRSCPLAVEPSRAGHGVRTACRHGGAASLAGARADVDRHRLVDAVLPRLLSHGDTLGVRLLKNGPG